MELQIFSLVKKASAGQLTEYEVRLLENLVRDYPYFSPTYAALALHHDKTGAPYAGEWKLKSAAMVPDRKALSVLFSSAPEVFFIEPVSPELSTSAETVLPDTATLSDEAAEVAGWNEEAALAEKESELSTPLAEPEAQTLTDIADTGLSEELAEPPPVKQPEIQPVQKAARPAGIDWGLNTRIRIRAGQFSSLPGKLLTEMRAYAAAHSTEQEQLSPVAKKPELKLREEKANVLNEMQAIPVKEKKAEAMPPLEMREARNKVLPEISEPEVKTAEQNPERPALSLRESKPNVLPVTEESGYTIGAFSGFSFLDSEDAENRQTAEEEKSGTSPEATLEDPEDGLIIEQQNRVLEVKITPEALNRYFGRKTAPEGKKGKALSQEEINEAAEAENTELKKASREEAEKIVDQFIHQDPRITPPEKYQFRNLNIGVGSIEEDENLVSETLAQIHARQGRNGRAIKIYQKLMLLYPAKKAYFATQIENLKRK